MAQDQKPNSETQPQDARPEDSGTTTQPRGNGDKDERDTERGREKLDSVLGN
jgi:hypothetical protein